MADQIESIKQDISTPLKEEQQIKHETHDVGQKQETPTDTCVSAPSLSVKAEIQEEPITPTPLLQTEAKTELITPKQTAPVKVRPLVADWDYTHRFAYMWWKGKRISTTVVKPEHDGDPQSLVLAHFELEHLDVRVAGIWWEVVLAGRTPAATSASKASSGKVFRVINKVRKAPKAYIADRIRG